MNPFTSAFDMDAKLGIGDAMVRLFGALALGAMVALVYRVSFDDLARLESAIASAGTGSELASITQPKGFDGIQRTWDVTLSDANAAERLAAELRSVQGVSAAEIQRA